MPAYYKVEELYQVLSRYEGKPILTAQEIEDVVAYLLTVQTLSSSLPGSMSEAPPTPAPYIVDGRRSGYTYLSEDNQRLQNDEFANPGFLWVERGRALW